METIPYGTLWSNRTSNGAHFKNIGPPVPDETIIDNVVWACNNCWRCLPGPPAGGYSEFAKTWFKPCNMANELERLRSSTDPEVQDKDHVFWIGHATSLLCLASGTNILFDPIFSYRASPFSWAGPPRKFPPATKIEELPNIDIITISHNHYDHMDERSLRLLHKRFPQALFVVPLKMGRTLIRWGIPDTLITHMDWWQELKIKDVVIGCTPAQHWCQHFALDRNEQLWCGWIIGWKPKKAESVATYSEPSQGSGSSTGDINEPAADNAEEEDDEEVDGIVPGAPTVNWNEMKTYFFTGDTSYNPNMFRLMHRRFPRIDMAALPIGAYAPRWYMASAHIDPENVSKVFNILHVRRAIAVHWGTFELADEPLDEPPELLSAAKAAEGIADDAFICIPLGTHVSF